MGITSSQHWSKDIFSHEVREVAATFLQDMRIQDPDSPMFGYYDPESQLRILVDAAITVWKPPVPADIAERAGILAMMVRTSELSPAGH